MTKTLTLLALANTGISQADASPISGKTWFKLSTKELLALIEDGDSDALDILKLRYNGRVKRGEKPRFPTMKALQDLGVLPKPAKTDPLTTALTVVEPKAEAKKAVAKAADAKPTKTTEDYVAIGEAKGVEWLLNMLKNASDPTKVANLTAAVAFLTVPAKPKASPQIDGILKALRSSGVDLKALKAAL
jgi:hypothetical protein